MYLRYSTEYICGISDSWSDISTFCSPDIMKAAGEFSPAAFIILFPSPYGEEALSIALT